MDMKDKTKHKASVPSWQASRVSKQDLTHFKHTNAYSWAPCSAQKFTSKIVHAKSWMALFTYCHWQFTNWLCLHTAIGGCTYCHWQFPLFTYWLCLHTAIGGCTYCHWQFPLFTYWLCLRTAIGGCTYCHWQFPLFTYWLCLHTAIGGCTYWLCLHTAIGSWLCLHTVTEVIKWEANCCEHLAA